MQKMPGFVLVMVILIFSVGCVSTNKLITREFDNGTTVFTVEDQRAAEIMDKIVRNQTDVVFGGNDDDPALEEVIPNLYARAAKQDRIITYDEAVAFKDWYEKAQDDERRTHKLHFTSRSPRERKKVPDNEEHKQTQSPASPHVE